MPKVQFHLEKSKKVDYNYWIKKEDYLFLT